MFSFQRLGFGSTFPRLATMAAIAVGAFGGVVRGVTITPAGAFNDVGPTIVTTYGTAGYDLYNTKPATFTGGTGTDSGPFLSGNRLSNLPSYISSVTANGAGSSFSSDQYALVNNPGGGQVHTGLTYEYSTPNTVQSLLRLAVGASAPSSFYVGVMTNLDSNPVDFPGAFELKQSGGSGDSGLFNTSGPIDGKLDVYFFKIDNAASGDLIDIDLTGQNLGTDGKIHLGTPGLLFAQSLPAAGPVPLPPGLLPAIFTIVAAITFSITAKRRSLQTA